MPSYLAFTLFGILLADYVVVLTYSSLNVFIPIQRVRSYT